jgi:predicted CXXCH cytochrome family protein
LATLVLALLLGGAAVAPAAAPFSHKLHLKLGMQCTTCHAAAAASTKLSDNLLPARELCLKCHQDPAAPAPRAARIARFSHQIHLKLGNVAPLIAAAIDSKSYLSPAGDIRKHLNTKNACGACHRGMEESEAVTHAAMPQMADCLVCHSRIEPPFSCEFCHEAGANLKPANHTPHFLDTHTSGTLKLDKTSCAVCHGRTFTCLGCH